MEFQRPTICVCLNAGEIEIYVILFQALAPLGIGVASGEQVGPTMLVFYPPLVLCVNVDLKWCNMMILPIITVPQQGDV